MSLGGQARVTPPTSRGPSAIAADPPRGAPTEPSPIVTVEPPAAMRKAAGPAAAGLQAVEVISRSGPAATSIAIGCPQAASLQAPAAAGGGVHGDVQPWGLQALVAADGRRRRRG